MMPREGTLIADRYRLERKVGGGRVAATWLVQDQVTQARCAVKLLHRSMNEHAEALARFSLEDRLARELTGAYFAERIGSGNWQSIRYIAWRWYDGECLRVLFERTPKQDAQTVNSVVQETCNALTAVHGAGYTHGDLKPENIFFAEGGEKARQLKLLGFGVASRLTQPLLGIQGRRTPGMIVGTPLYLSPDQILGRVPRGGQGDLWALAVIVYEALTGRPPFLGDDLGQVLQAILERRAPKPTSVTSNLPATLDQWWAQALEQSFATAGDFATALSRALAPALRSSRTQRSASLPASAESAGAGRGAGAVVVSPSASVQARRASEAAKPTGAAGAAKLASAEKVSAPAMRAAAKATSGGTAAGKASPAAASSATERAAGGTSGRERAPERALRSAPAASKAAAAAAGETLPSRTPMKASPSGPAARAGAARVAAASGSGSAGSASLASGTTPAPARVSGAATSAGASREASGGGARPSLDVASTLLGTGAAAAGAAAITTGSSAAGSPAAGSSAAGSPAAGSSAAGSSAAGSPSAAGSSAAGSPAGVSADAGAGTAAAAPPKDADATPRAPEPAPKPAATAQTPRPHAVKPGAPGRGARAATASSSKEVPAKSVTPQASRPAAPKAPAPQDPGKDGAAPKDSAVNAVSANAALFRAAVAAAVDSGLTPQRSRKGESEAVGSAAPPLTGAVAAIPGATLPGAARPATGVPAAASEPPAAAEEPARRAAAAGASHTTPGLGPAAASMIRALQTAAAEAAAASIRVVGGSDTNSPKGSGRSVAAGLSGANAEASRAAGDARTARELRADSESSFAPLPSPVQDLSSTGTRKTLVGIIPPAQLGAVATRGSSRSTAAPNAGKRDRAAIEGAPCRSIDVSEADAGADSNPLIRRGSHPTVPFARPRAARRRGSRGTVQDPSSLDSSLYDGAPHDPAPYDRAPYDRAPYDTVPHHLLPHDLQPHETLSHDTVPELGPLLEFPEQRAAPSGDPWSFRTMRTSGTLRIVLGNANRVPHLVAGLLVCAAAALVIFVLGRSPVAGTGPIGQTMNSLEPPAGSPAPRAPLASSSAAGERPAGAADGSASGQAEENAAPGGVPESPSAPTERSVPATPPAAAVTPSTAQPPAAMATAPGSPQHASPGTLAKPKAPERMAAPGAPVHPAPLAPNSSARAPNPTPSRAVPRPASGLVLPPPAPAKGGVPPRAPPGKAGPNNPGAQTASPARPANGDFDFGI